MNKVHVKIIGNGQPIIMLHGWGWHSSIWEPLIPQLAKNYKLFLIDLPGFGQSDFLSDEYTFENIAKKIFPIIPFQSIWLGWSLGGMLAFWTAIHYPERVKRLITIAASPKFTRDIDWPGVDIPSLEKFSELLVIDYKKTLRDFLELQLRGSPNKTDLFYEIEKKIVPSQTNPFPALMGGLNLLRNTDLRSELYKIQSPSLHFFGALDTLVPKTIISQLQARIPTSQCEIINRTGHMPFLTHPEDFISLLNRFLL